jgi:NAD-dependent deacetylase
MDKKMNITVFTGAGVSAESGIPTFRDRATGIWENVDPIEVASLESWNEDPQMVCKFHEEIRTTIKDKEPNDAHKFIADLEKDHNVTVITQNIDDLHEKAGSSNVLHLHGEINKAVCQCTDEVYEIDGDRIMFGKESVDGFIYKPNTVLFGEYPYKVDESLKALKTSDILIIIGTSFEISYILPMLVDGLPRTSKVYYIDKSPAYNLFGHFKDVTVIPKKATEGVKELGLN